MALKNDKGEYLQVAGIEGFLFRHGKIGIRIYKWDSEEDRQNKPDEPEENYFVEADISDLPKLTGSKTIYDVVQKIGYSALKNHKVWKEEIKHEATEGKEAYTETVFDYPYSDMIDC